MKENPDFIVIGAMKCATSTLHNQLGRQPGIFTTDPKEPCFFSDDHVWARGQDWYAALFGCAASKDLTGESSTHYTKLPTYPRTIERMQRFLNSDVKFIYLMRHPVDRLISQYIHEWSARRISSDLDVSVERNPELIKYGMYAYQLRPFLEAFGPQRILPVFWDRLISNPQGEIERIGRYIGYHTRPIWNFEVKSQNVSAERARKPFVLKGAMTLPGSSVARRLAPKKAVDWVKGFWTMKERPILSPKLRLEVEATFNRDLEQLGDWLDLRLDCNEFRQATKTTIPEWKTKLSI